MGSLVPEGPDLWHRLMSASATASGPRRLAAPTSRSLGNPLVHSLSVTLGNHTILPTQPYNDPCPKDHLLTYGEVPMEW